ncbi:hypothetical protein Taro_049379 [Colocasia esculenta]|uniref:Uncharacterized protein n=1 Tax=Colocasia esculenta TaxID=4460 RepID=A0A843XAL9_COLES|nr:hypothetical protein [Colocasia esculenta]
MVSGIFAIHWHAWTFSSFVDFSENLWRLARGFVPSSRPTKDFHAIFELLEGLHRLFYNVAPSWISGGGVHLVGFGSEVGASGPPVEFLDQRWGAFGWMFGGPEVGCLRLGLDWRMETLMRKRNGSITSLTTADMTTTMNESYEWAFVCPGAPPSIKEEVEVVVHQWELEVKDQ